MRLAANIKWTTFILLGKKHNFKTNKSSEYCKANSDSYIQAQRRQQNKQLVLPQNMENFIEKSSLIFCLVRKKENSGPILS